MKLFLTSVGKSVEDIRPLKDLINERTKLVVLPFAHDFNWLSCAEDVWEKYDRCPKAKNSIFYKTVEPFINKGIDVNNIVVINRFTDSPALIKHKLLADNTIVYLPGGRPENIMKILRSLRLTSVIKQCKVIVGESAGAMIWSKHYFVYPDNDYPAYRHFRGLNVTRDCVIIPHFTLTDNKEILKSCRRFSWLHKDKIRLVVDGGWVYYDTEFNVIMKHYKSTRY